MSGPARAAGSGLLGCLLVTSAMLGSTTAASARTAKEVQALTRRAVAHIQDVGRDQAFADFSRPGGGFVDGELYIFCHDISGVVVAHGGNPKIVGRNMSDVRGPDGRLSNVEIDHLGPYPGQRLAGIPLAQSGDETHRIEVCFRP